MSGNTGKYIKKLQQEKSQLIMRLEKLTDAAKLFGKSNKEAQEGFVEVLEKELDNLDFVIWKYGMEGEGEVDFTIFEEEFLYAYNLYNMETQYTKDKAKAEYEVNHYKHSSYDTYIKVGTYRGEA